MSRKNDRKHAFNLVFQLDFFQDASPEELFSRYFEKEIFSAEELALPANADKGYVMETLAGVWEHIEEIDGIIEARAVDWEFFRLVKTDIAILRLAVYELFFSEKTPHRVAINEAVELAKEYSGGSSPGFVNGLLGQISRAMSGSSGL